ncbi:MAG: hypothetical protein ABW051_03820, partial [Burkholderiaceae bacterium]
GIMGSGKSTSTRWLHKLLADAGIEACLHTERQFPHPLRGTDLSGDWFKPWLDTTPEQLAARRLQKWKAYVDTAMASPAVHVIDGQLFHGDLTNLFLMKMSPAAIEENLLALQEIIRPLNPLLVYYVQSDVDLAIRRTAEERGEELGVRYQVEWKLKYALPVERGYVGLDGLSLLYQDYRVLTDALYERLTLDKIRIENSARAWSEYYPAISEALGIPALGMAKR